MINTKYELDYQVEMHIAEEKDCYLILNKLVNTMSITKFRDLLIGFGVKASNIDFYVPEYKKIYNKNIFSWYELNIEHMLRDLHFRVRDVCVGGSPHDMQIIIRID